MFKDLIPKDEFKRSVKLLGNVRRDFGIDNYLLLRKMLIVVLITEYYQRKYKIDTWISYNQFLARNEQHARDCKGVTSNPDFAYKNFLGGTTHPQFFGIPSDIVIKGTPIQVIDTEHEYWREELVRRNKETPF
jgi:hypothetical protein